METTLWCGIIVGVAQLDLERFRITIMARALKLGNRVRARASVRLQSEGCARRGNTVGGRAYY